MRALMQTQKMLMQYFDGLPARKPENYALAFGKYRCEASLSYQMEMEEREDDKTLPEPDLPQFLFPLQVSFKAVTDTSGRSPLSNLKNFPASFTTTSAGVWRRETFRAGVSAVDTIFWR